MLHMSKLPSQILKLFGGGGGWRLVPLLSEYLKRLLVQQKGKVFVQILHLVGICSFWSSQLVTFPLSSLSTPHF